MPGTTLLHQVPQPAKVREPAVQCKCGHTLLPHILLLHALGRLVGGPQHLQPTKSGQPDDCS